MTEARPLKKSSFLPIGLLLVFSCVILACGLLTPDGGFSMFYDAAQRFLHRQNPYSIPAIGDDPHPFVYPPAALLLLLGPAHFSYFVAKALWDVMDLAFYLAAIYLWTELLKAVAPAIRHPDLNKSSSRQSVSRDPAVASTSAWAPAYGLPGRRLDLLTHPSWPGFIKIVFMATLMPVFWAFWCHHMVIPVFFFTTWTLWLLVFRQKPFWTGVAAGLMLLKPHLTAPLALFVFFKTGHKRLFTAGLVLAFVIPCLPFLIGFRPPSDLRAGLHHIRELESHYYFLDSQHALAALERRTEKIALPLHPLHDAVAMTQNGTRSFETFKKELYGLVLSGLVIGGLKIGKDHWVRWASVVLACSVLFSIYSHFVDGIFVMPLALVALKPVLEQKGAVIFIALFALANFSLAYTFFYLTQAADHFIPWIWMSWVSLAYFGVACIFISRGYLEQKCILSRHDPERHD